MPSETKSGRWPKYDPTRDRLIDKVRHGKITPDGAGAEAKRLKLDPLAGRPNAEDFDPMQEQFWTLPMAAAWIAYRTPDAVREWWDKYRELCKFWKPQRWQIGEGPIINGHLLEQWPAASLDLLRMGDEFEDSQDGGRASVASTAIDELLVKLQAGRLNESGKELIATGIDQDSRRRVSISKEQWRDLRASEENGREVFCAEMKPGGSLARFEDVTVLRSAVEKMWPPGGKLRRTGPGRPTARKVAIAELKGRAERGELKPTLGAEAKFLRGWLDATHPLYPSMAQTTMENNIRSDYWRLRNN